jgi:hypothetical protein
MALSQSALNELLEAVRAGDGEDVLRDAMALVLQELIELEASQAIGAGGYSAPRPATSNCTSPSSERAASSRPCSSRVGASTGRCGR